MATGDLFNDEKIHLVTENVDGGPIIRAPEGRSPNHWISFQLDGTKCNRLALNARARLVELTFSSDRLAIDHDQNLSH
jgi:hypothetical protein